MRIKALCTGGCRYPEADLGAQVHLPVQWNVATFGEHKLEGSLKWMGAFWVSVAGVL